MINTLMLRMQVLNICKFDFYQVLDFMFNIITNTAPQVFQTQCTDAQHQYSTIFSKNSSTQDELVCSRNKFSVSSRGPRFYYDL